MSKARLLFPVLALVAVLSLSSCLRRSQHGSGVIKKENRNLSGAFTHIEISAPVNVVINTQQAAGPLQLEGDDNLLQFIVTEVRDNTLYIDVKPHNTRMHPTKDFKLAIAVAELAGLSVSGAGDVTVNGTVATNDFSLDISGAGDVAMSTLQAQRLKADITGSGSLKVDSGKVTNAEYDISGAGDVDAFGLQTDATTISISGAGDADITVNTKLDASVSGAGSITYKGQPAITKNISGAGSVNPAR